MSEQIKEGAPVKPVEPVAEQQETQENTEAPAVQEGEAAAEAEPTEPEQTEEAAPAEGEVEPVAEAPKQEAQQPGIPQDVADAAANWATMQAIMERNPSIMEQAKAEFQRMNAPKAQQAPQDVEMDDATLKREFQTLYEAGKIYEANKLLAERNPTVVRAKLQAEQAAVAEYQRGVEARVKELQSHEAVFGKIDPEVRKEMRRLYGNEYGGNYVSAHVAALTNLGKVSEAAAILAKAGQKRPAQKSVAAGGRIPAATGAPAARRVAKQGPTPGSGFSSEELSYIDKRERERGGHL